MNNFVSVILWELLGMISLSGISRSANPNWTEEKSLHLTLSRRFKLIVL